VLGALQDAPKGVGTALGDVACVRSCRLLGVVFRQNVPAGCAKSATGEPNLVGQDGEVAQVAEVVPVAVPRRSPGVLSPVALSEPVPGVQPEPIWLSEDNPVNKRWTTCECCVNSRLCPDLFSHVAFLLTSRGLRKCLMVNELRSCWTYPLPLIVREG
jgi:hypothetical protein